MFVSSIDPVSAERPAAARRLVRSKLAGMTPVVIGTVELLTSELMNNAIVHGSGLADLVLEIEDGCVHVEVRDFEPTVELAPLQLEASSVRGRGLAIVDALAAKWGVESRPGGKVVWFDVTT